MGITGRITINNENTTKKCDSLGRVVIPKSIRDRLQITPETVLDVYIIEDDKGKEYVSFGPQKKEKKKNVEFMVAAKVLHDLGLPIPDELKREILK